MSSTYLNAMAVCPFYMYDEHASRSTNAAITCEGIYGRATKTLFKKQRDKDEHAEQFCASIEGCKRCEIYRLVERKYKR